MADYQRVHPVSVESPPPPSAPAAPDNLSQSDNHEKSDQLPLFTPTVVSQPVEPRRKRKRSCCCRCLCWTTITIIALIIAIAITVGILYLVARPKIPDYSIDQLTVTAFSVNSNNSTVHASFNVMVTAQNPNKMIGIYYDDGSEISAWYNVTMLCNGTWPVFYQGHRNTTVINLALTGDTKFDNQLIAQVSAQEKAGSIPLTVKADVPIRVKFGAVKLFGATAKVNCNLVVDSLSANNQIQIRSSSCKFKLKF